MALETMHGVLYKRLGDEGASDAQKAVWQSLWNGAQDKSGEPLPCPVCFVATGKAARLSARPNVGDMAAARCDVCRTEFRWPNDNG